MVEIDLLLKKFSALQAERDRLIEVVSSLQEDVDSLSTKYDAVLKARSVIQTVAKQTQKNLEYRISSIVSAALNAIPFDDKYEFKIEFEERRGKTEADIWLVKNGEKCKPIDAVGGGVCDIVSFGLVCTFKAMKPTRDVLVLDEPLKHLSPDLQPHASEMLKMLCNELGLQIIMVSHNEGIIEEADNVIRIG